MAQINLPKPSALEQPPVLKIKYSYSGRGNYWYANYIATREGVDLSAVKGMEDMQEMAPDSTYAQYIGERPRSEGLFSADPHEPPDLTDTKREVRTHDGPIWRGIISFTEVDADTMQYRDGQAWRDLTRRLLPRIAEEGMGLRPGEYRWVAAHHKEPGHPHVHYMLWQSNNAPRRKPLLNKDEMQKVRRVMTQEVYGDLRAQITADKTIMRDLIVSQSRVAVRPGEDAKLKLEKAVDRADKELVASGRLAPSVLAPTSWPQTDIDHLTDRLGGLAKQMPGQGRAALAYMPEEIKKEARDIADWVLSRPSLAKSRSQWERSVDDLTSLYSNQPQRHKEARDKAYADLRDRVAQAVVQRSADVNRVQRSGELHVKQNTKSVFEAAFRGLHAERQKAEAQAEIAKRQAAQQRVAEQEFDNERGR